MTVLHELRTLVEEFSPGRRTRTLIPRLTLMRSETATEPAQTVMEPMLCVVLQGRKRAMLGDATFEYHPAQYLVVSVGLPVSGQITEASADTPYLAIGLRLDPAMLASLLLDMPPAPATEAAPGLAVSPIRDELLEPLLRLVRLLRRPHEIALMAPLAEREILYRLLADDPILRQMAQVDSRMSQVNRAISWLRQHYAQPFQMEALAQVANMSASTLHRHFKAVTRMSPLQFQKLIRLQAARQLLASQAANAASVGFAVGYESPSQFSREYRRLYGEPPARDTARMRGAPAPVET